jgi:hypothetical protein
VDRRQRGAALTRSRLGHERGDSTIAQVAGVLAAPTDPSPRQVAIHIDCDGGGELCGPTWPPPTSAPIARASAE